MIKREEEKKRLRARGKGNKKGLVERITYSSMANGRPVPLDHPALRLTFSQHQSQQKWCHIAGKRASAPEGYI